MIKIKTMTIEMAQTATGKWYIVPSRGDIATTLRNAGIINDSTQPDVLEKIIDFCFSHSEDPEEVARNLCSFFIHNQLREIEIKRVSPRIPK